MTNAFPAVQTKCCGNTEERMINSAWRKLQRINICIGPLEGKDFSRLRSRVRTTQEKTHWNKSFMRQSLRRSKNLEHKKRSGRDEAEKQGQGQILEGLSMPCLGVKIFLCSLCGAIKRFSNLHGKTHSGDYYLLADKRQQRFHSWL